MLRGRWPLLGCLLAAGFVSTPAAAVSSQPYDWRNVKIGGGGFVSGVVFHPAQKNLLFLRTDVGGAYRWDARGRRWIPLNDGLNRTDALLAGVLSLALDPHDPSRVYLACGSYTSPGAAPAAILRSADQGETWSVTRLPFRAGGNEDGRSDGERLQVDPHDGRILFLGASHNGLWKSADRARSWSPVPGFSARSLTFVLFDPRTGSAGRPTPVLYAGVNSTTAPALWRSIDAGAHWTAIPAQPAGLLPTHAALAADGILYVTWANRLGPNGMTDGAVWKLNPTTNAWTDITPLSPRHGDCFGYGGLAADARHAGTLMVTTMDRWKKGDEIYRTIDGGRHWEALGPQAVRDGSSAPWVYWHQSAPSATGWMGGIAIDPFDSDRVLTITGQGVWSCGDVTQADAGRPTHWRFCDAGIEETVPLALISPPAGAHLLSALGDIDGFRHDDLGVSPPGGMFNLAFGTNESIAFAASKPNLIVRTHANGATRGSWSADGGATWQPFASAPSPAIANGPGVIAISADGTQLVWLPRHSAAWHSSDGGATWTASRGSPVSPAGWSLMTPVADHVNPEKFYLYDSVTGGVFASADGGASFSPVARGLPAGGGVMRAAPGREGDLWLPAPDGLYRSLQSGRHFQRVPGVQAAWQLGFGKAGPGRDCPAVYLWGKIAGVEGIFRSDDAGATWIRINDARHQFGLIHVLTGDPRIYGRVYVGTGGRGILYGDPR